MKHNKLKPINPSVVNVLKQAGEKFTLLDIDSQENIFACEWLETNFPFVSWGRIDWNSVPNSLCLSWDNTDELVSSFEKIVMENKLKNSLTVVWTNALRPSLKIDMKVMLKYAEAIFEEDWDTWVYSEKDNWCIEIFHDGDICFGHNFISKDLTLK